MGEHVHRWFIRVGKKAGAEIGRTPRGKGSKWMVVVDGQSIPLGIHVASARPAEIKLVDATLKTIRVPRRGGGRPRQYPDRLIADRGYDSDPLRRRLRRRGVLAIVPHRNWNLRRQYDDGRHLRRYRRFWTIERRSRGSAAFVACWFVTSDSRPCTVRCCISPRRSSRYGGFETSSLINSHSPVNAVTVSCPMILRADASVFPSEMQIQR